jgi:hypothetical protein
VPAGCISRIRRAGSVDKNEKEFRCGRHQGKAMDTDQQKMISFFLSSTEIRHNARTPSK